MSARDREIKTNVSVTSVDGCLKFWHTPDSKVREAYVGPTWGRQDPGGPHVGPMKLVVRDPVECLDISAALLSCVDYLSFISRYFKSVVLNRISIATLIPAFFSILARCRCSKHYCNSDEIFVTDCIIKMTASPVSNENFVKMAISPFQGRFAVYWMEPGVILSLHPANETRRYFVTASHIAWNQPCRRCAGTVNSHISKF